MLEVLKMSKVVDDNQLGTVVGKYINGSTLYNMHLVKTVIRVDTDLQESNILSNLMDNFPPICKQDPLDVRAHYVYEHWKVSRHFSEIKAIWLAFDSLFYLTTEHLILREKGKKVQNTPFEEILGSGVGYIKGRC